MANVWNEAISILLAYLDLGCSYPITTVISCTHVFARYSFDKRKYVPSTYFENPIVNWRKIPWKLGSRCIRIEIVLHKFWHPIVPGQKERKGGKRTTSRSFYDASFSFKVLLTVRKLHLFDCSNAKNRNS